MKNNPLRSILAVALLGYMATVAVAALSLPIVQFSGTPIQTTVQRVRPITNVSPWQDLVTDVTATDDQTHPAAITRTGQNQFDNLGEATLLDVRLKYPAGLTVTTNPIVYLVGFDQNGVPMYLQDTSGNKSWTLTPAGTDTIDASGMHYTSWVQVDMQGCRYVVACVQTAIAVSAGTLTGTTIQVKAM